jgi:hypothetical protein
MLSRNRWCEGFASIPWESAPDYLIRDLDPPRLRRLIIDSLLCFTSDIKTYGRAVACPRPAQKTATNRSLRYINWQSEAPSVGAKNKLKICFASSCGRE